MHADRFAESSVVLTPDDLSQWRKEQRERLIAERRAIPVIVRRDMGPRIEAHLRDAIGDVRGLTVGGYWPFQAEPDMRGFMQDVIARGGRCALPVVVARGQPLIFRLWNPDQKLERGVWNIPIPSADAETVQPDVLLAPVVGFDAECYRLGYGGGFFDRTLEAMGGRPRAFGVGYAQAQMPTVHPQPYDVPLHAIVTEVDVLWRR